MPEKLQNYLIKKIKQGPLSFYDFMKNALYHPSEGYYSNNAPKIGKDGDFYTSSYIHSAFGYCIADQIKEMWYICGKPNVFFIVEIGAGTGLLAKDILDYSMKNNMEFFNALKYILIETSTHMVELQKKQLTEYYQKCMWTRSIRDLESFIGVVFSNELLDAFPVHRLINIGGKLKEIYVKYENDSFVEDYGNISNKKLINYLNDLEIELEEDQEIEVNLDLIDWLRDIYIKLDKGYLLTIDYGYLTRELKEPFRFKGTLLSYTKHKTTENILLHPGKQDITAHVNFSALNYYGDKIGFKTLGYTTQMRFLVNLGITEKTSNPLAIKKLIMPDGMGERFKVLIHCKGVKHTKLKGLSSFFNSLKI